MGYSPPKPNPAFKPPQTKQPVRRQSIAPTGNFANGMERFGHAIAYSGITLGPVMHTYTFEAMDPQGAEIRDTVEAVSSEQAQAMIRSMGYFVTKISLEKPEKRTGIFLDYDYEYKSSRKKSHLKEVDMGYFHHMQFAFCTGCRLIIAGSFCLIHSMLPFFFTDKASTAIRKLHKTLENREVQP